MLNKILIIEDEKSLLDTLTLNLQIENYEVFGLNNGKDALNQINIIKPDLILLDIMLPNVSGIDIFKEMLIKFILRSDLPAFIVPIRYNG